MSISRTILGPIIEGYRLVEDCQGEATRKEVWLSTSSEYWQNSKFCISRQICNLQPEKGNESIERKKRKKVK